jgi:ankyrin repeat protein
MSKGANIHAADCDGWQPIHHASNAGNEPLTAALIARGANVNAVDQKIIVTALHLAASKGYHKILSLLIKAGAEVNNDIYVVASRRY